MSWLYKGKSFKDSDIGDKFGYVYLIQNLTNNMIYLGRKYFSVSSYKQVKGKRKKTRKPSDYVNYWGSNKLLLEDIKKLGKRQFKRNIIGFCYSRSECSYTESAVIFYFNALLSPMFYNYWISCKITKSHTASFANTDRVNECIRNARAILDATTNNK